MATLLQILGLIGIAVAVALLAPIGWAVLAGSVELVALGVAMERAARVPVEGG